MPTTSQPIPQHRLVKTTIPGPKSSQLHAKRQTVVSDSFGFVLPIFVEEAGGGILVDVDGNQLIDLASGIAVTSVGASNPRVVAAVQEQVAKFTHTCFMVTEYEGFVDVCDRLVQLAPGDAPKKAGLFNTGAEAVENAVKIARVATGRDAVVALSHGYHGRSLLTMTLTAKQAPYKHGFGPFAPEVYRAPSPYAYRWPTGAENAAEEGFAALVDLIETQIGADQVAAIIIEPIQGEGGFIPMPDGYLTKVTEYAKANGIVFIADEVQSGVGRSGDMWAVDHEGVVPDLMTVAKALGGGLPLAAVVGRADLMDAVPAGGLGGTYVGNPVACAAALGALESVEQDGLVEAARQIEAVAMPRLKNLVDTTDIIGDARGRGAMLAIEFVEPGGTKPNSAAAKAVAASCLEQGVLVLVTGTYSNCIRLLPPLVIGEDLLLDALGVLEGAVRSVANG